MIRLIRRCLIIPQGDTGTFTIPIQGTMEAGDVALFSIYDPLTRTNLLVLKGEVDSTNNVLNFNFIPENTLNIEPSNRYQWDITIYRGAVYNEETQKITSATTVDSYYAAFKLPTCDIRTVTSNVQK